LAGAVDEAIDTLPVRMCSSVRVIIWRAVQLDLPFLRAAEPAADPRPPEYPEIEFVRMRRARRYILRVRPGGGLRVTIPRGGSRAEAARFVHRQAAWIEKQRARVRSAGVSVVWGAGATLLLRGEQVRLEITGAPGGLIARYGDRTVQIPGPGADVRGAIERDLSLIARAELGGRLRDLAQQHNLVVAGFSIRNQKSRWGSCSRHGRIALNFRLVQMPPHVSDYVLIHELMHLKQQNHSRKFWRLVEAACPDFRVAERWLKTEGRALF
jgi:predicted metal-dependent hydrolase